MGERSRWGLVLSMVRNSAGGWSYEWQDQHGAVRCSGWTLALDPEAAADDAERHLLRAAESAGENERNLVALLDLYFDRAEDAERERDEARREAERLRAYAQAGCLPGQLGQHQLPWEREEGDDG